MPIYYDKLASYYDLEYGHKNDDLDFYLDVADAYGSPILEIGAGTGRLTLPLANEGHTVWGIDNSAEMLKKAHDKISAQPEDLQKRIVLSQQDMRDFNLDQKFSLCIIPFRAFLHNLTIDDQLNTLTCIHDHLTDDGMLVFDLFVPLYSMLNKTVWHEDISEEELADANSGVSISCDITHNADKQLLSIQNTYKTTNNKTVKHNMVYRYIFRYEMELLLRLAGYNVEEFYGGFDEQPYNFHSGLLVGIASKAL